MTTATTTPQAGRFDVRKVLTVAVIVGLVLSALIAFRPFNGVGNNKVTAVFNQTVNIHPGDEVRILGVKVGSVDKVEPTADSVKVTMTYDDEYKLAADATAAVVTPTLVSVRYIQLGPLAEGSGKKALADGANIPLTRTAAPLEWDEIKDQVTELTEVLGPDEKDTQGALSRILDASAKNLDGQGTELRASLKQLAGAFDTLSRGGADLFTVVQNLDTFVKALAQNNTEVATFNNRLATVAGILSDNRNNLSGLLKTLDSSTTVVTKFIKNNRARLASTITDLSSITGNLAKSRQALADVLQRTPIAASNLSNIYDPFSGAVTTSVAATNFNDPAQFLCGIAMGAAAEGPTSTQARQYCETALDPLLDIIRVPVPPVGVDGIERDGKNTPKGNR